MKILFDNENKRFRLLVKDSDGNTVVDPANVQSIQVLLKYEYNNETWLDYRYPVENDHPEVELLNGQFSFEITTEQAAKVRQGNIIVVVNYQVSDSNFSEGFRSFTQKGKIFLTKKV